MGVTVTKKSRLTQIGRQFPDEANRVVREAVMDVERDVVVNIVKYGAVDTGTMLGSVRGEMTGQAEGMVSVNAESEEGYPYPVAVNYGTRYVPARPFFTDAVEQERQRFPERFRGIGGGVR